MTYSLVFVNRERNPKPALVQAAEHWIAQYNAGETDFCWCCGRRLALPEPPPICHVFIGDIYDDDMAVGYTGGICDECSKRDRELCLADVLAYVRKRFGEDLECIFRPHEIHQPGRA